MRMLWISSALLLMANLSLAQSSRLGTIEFPTSTTSEEAQAFFLEGVGLLHSFEWEDAAEAFQKAQELDPDFAMAYWGEALSHTGGHHFPPEQDMSQAREALGRLGANRAARLAKAPSEREKGYLEAVELLYGDGDALERSRAYSEAMRRLSEKYPEDDEAATFYALSLMRTVVRGEDSIRQDMQAGAIAQRVYRKNPDHPGAAHYIIHAYDDPVHAPIALYAAHKYADIAPDAVHALHMPSHIFVQHGMWGEVAASNEASYGASVARVDRKGLSPTKRSFHALYWLQYAYLQQGRYEDAQECIEKIRPVARRQDSLRGIEQRLIRMEALQAVETERWRVTDIDALVAQIDEDPSQVHAATAGAELFATGMSAAKTGKLDVAERAEAALGHVRRTLEDKDEDGRKQMAMMQLELGAMVHLAKGNREPALELLREATAISESMVPPSGPPGESDTDPPIKPAHELFGEALLDLGRAAEAQEQFAISLLRMPNRPRSLLGAARAAVATGDRETARRRYEEITRIPGAGENVPGMEEARAYLRKPTEE